MKLTKHQEQIVDKIVDGKVYDITTYLKEFDKAHKQKYDIEEIRKVFENLEEDKRYSFTEKDSYYYTKVTLNPLHLVNTEFSPKALV